jgi:hypothetical protein
MSFLMNVNQQTIKTLRTHDVYQIIFDSASDESSVNGDSCKR